MINGQEVNQMVYDDVISLIRTARDVENGRLILTVQQKGMCIYFYLISLLFGVIILLQLNMFTTILKEMMKKKAAVL